MKDMRTTMCGERGGYSLIEMMVVIGVTLVLSATLLSYNHSSERQFLVYRDQELLVSALNRAKALAVKRFSSPGACAFGVHLDKDTHKFILFEDVNTEEPPSSVFGCRDDAGNYVTDLTYNGDAEKLESIPLDSRLAISFQNQDGEITMPVDVVFLPPNPTIYSSFALPLLVTIRTADATFSSYIEISPAGQITTTRNAPF